eukprot:m.305973 g.305973  ORF g.305973 m.305973 type:complete len:115 (+) comp40868_c0_seq1:196-540(+)
MLLTRPQSQQIAQLAQRFARRQNLQRFTAAVVYQAVIALRGQVAVVRTYATAEPPRRLASSSCFLLSQPPLALSSASEEAGSPALRQKLHDLLLRDDDCACVACVLCSGCAVML